MSSLPISYHQYPVGDEIDNHILIPSPSSILLLGNNHHLVNQYNHHHQQHQQQQPAYHNHRSITMNMLQHQQLIDCFAQHQEFPQSISDDDNNNNSESASSSSDVLLLPTNLVSGGIVVDETCISSSSASVDGGENSYLHHQKGAFDSFDSNGHTSSSSAANFDSSRNNSFSSSSFPLMEEPIFILSPSNSTTISPAEEHSLLPLSSSLYDDNMIHHNNHNNLMMINNDDVVNNSKDFNKLSFTTTNNNQQQHSNHQQTPTIRSSPRDIKPNASSKVAYSLNDTKSTQTKGQIEEGISELEQLFASRRAFNSLSKKYSTDNLLKEQKKRNKHSNEKDHHLLLLQSQQQQQPSLTYASSFSAVSTTSTSFLEPSSNAIRSTKSTSALSPSSPISDSFEEIKTIIQSYYNYESFVESADGREELRLYLRKRHNEEMLLMLETRITFLSFYEEGSNFYVGKRALLKVKEFQMIYSQFIDTNSQFCINIDSSIRNKFVKLNPRVNLVNTEEEATLLVKEIDECLDTLHFSVSLQVKTEIFSQFKKTEEFQTFILSKIIELQGKKAWEELERQSGSSLHDSPVIHGGFFSFRKKNPQNSAIKKFEEKSIEEFLIENELSEYCGQFRKKKLYTLSQIQNYSCDDYLKLGVIKVTHQTRLIRLVGQYFKSYCNKN